MLFYIALTTALGLAPLAAAAPTVAVAQQTVGTFRYAGCYQDASPRILSAKSSFVLTMTLERCASYCTGYEMWGVEYGSQCFCGNSFTRTPPLRPDSECVTMGCGGNASQPCGSGWRLMVYKAPVTTNVEKIVSSKTSISVTTTKTGTTTLPPRTITSTLQTSIKASSTLLSNPPVSSSPTALPKTSASSSPTPASSEANAISSTSSSVSSKPTTAVSKSGKRGLAYNDASLANLFVGGANSQVTWGYNWYSASGGLSPALDFAPMLWSGSASLVSVWGANVAQAIAAGSTHVLGFNEPDLNVQSNMTVAEAVAAWRQYIQPYAGKIKLGAPAVTNGGSPMGLTWLQSFLTQCTGCTIDFIPIHWYDSATNPYYFKWYMQQAGLVANGRPVWITEFQGYGTQAQQIAMLEQVMPWLDSLSYIERYAWFGVFDQNLVSGGQINALGQTYMSYTSTTIDPIFAS